MSDRAGTVVDQAGRGRFVPYTDRSPARVHQNLGPAALAKRATDPAAPPAGYFRMFTARAMTRATVTSDTADWNSIAIFAQRDSGSTSVGLNAVALVNDR